MGDMEMKKDRDGSFLDRAYSDDVKRLLKDFRGLGKGTWALGTKVSIQYWTESWSEDLAPEAKVLV